MAPAQIGPLTTLLEAVAVAVGAGIVLGGFAMGTYRLMSGWPRRELEAKVLTGGIVGAFVAFLDLILRYG